MLEQLLDIDSLTRNWAQYEQRCVEGLAFLARTCQLDVTAELERFEQCRLQLNQQRQSATGEDWVAEVTRAVGERAPLIFELVLTLVGGVPRSLAYLTQGKVSNTLPASLAGLLEGTLRFHVAQGGAAVDRATLVELFRLCFPQVQTLSDYSPLAQGMLVGVAPAASGIRLKIYFNTRLDPTTPHQERVSAILDRLGLEDPGVYDALYGKVETARFHGVGVDLGGSRLRAKLYVRLDKEQLLPAVRALSDPLPPSTGAAMVCQAEQLQTGAGAPEVNDEIELAVALAVDTPPTAKLTLFLGDRAATAKPPPSVAQYFREAGGDVSILREGWSIFGGAPEGEPPAASPIHGIGVELREGPPKQNIYWRPVG